MALGHMRPRWKLFHVVISQRSLACATGPGQRIAEDRWTQIEWRMQRRLTARLILGPVRIRIYGHFGLSFSCICSIMELGLL